MNPTRHYVKSDTPKDQGANPANAGLNLLDAASLRRTQRGYQRLLQQLDGDPATTVAAANVRRYLAEISEISREVAA